MVHGEWSTKCCDSCLSPTCVVLGVSGDTGFSLVTVTLTAYKLEMFCSIPGSCQFHLTATTETKIPLQRVSFMYPLKLFGEEPCGVGFTRAVNIHVYR